MRFIRESTISTPSSTGSAPPERPGAGAARHPRHLGPRAGGDDLPHLLGGAGQHRRRRASRGTAAGRRTRRCGAGAPACRPSRRRRSRAARRPAPAGRAADAFASGASGATVGPSGAAADDHPREDRYGSASAPALPRGQGRACRFVRRGNRLPGNGRGRARTSGSAPPSTRSTPRWPSTGGRSGSPPTRASASGSPARGRSRTRRRRPTRRSRSRSSGRCAASGWARRGSRSSACATRSRPSISAQLGDAELRVSGEDWAARLVLAPGEGPLRAASEAAARIKAASRGAVDAARRRLRTRLRARARARRGLPRRRHRARGRRPGDRRAPRRPRADRRLPRRAGGPARAAHARRAGGDRRGARAARAGAAVPGGADRAAVRLDRHRGRSTSPA